MTAKRDYYQIMGVKRDASQDEIKRAYRKLARKYHPDVSKEHNAEVKFKEVGESYECLKDPDKRKRYDQLGHGWNEPIQSRGSWKRGGDTESFVDLEEILRRAGAAYASGDPDNVNMGGYTTRPQQVKIPLSMMIKGGNIGVQARRTRSVVRGQMSMQHVDTSVVHVAIPPNAKMGQKIKTTQNGTEYTFIIYPGNDYHWTVSGHDIISSFEVDIFQAVLGHKGEFIDPWGKKGQVSIPAGISEGSIVRLVGKGIQDIQGRTGNLLLKINITTPVLNEKQKEILKKAVDKIRS